METRHTSLSPYYLLLAGVLLQGLSPVFTKLLLVDLSEAAVVTSRYLLALALFVPVLAAQRSPRILQPPRRRDWVALCVMGLLGSGIGSLLFTWALSYAQAGVVHALSKTAPLFVAVLAYLVLQERITGPRLALVGVMVLADVLIAAGDLSVGGAEARRRLIGDGLALSAGLCRAGSEVLAKGLLRRFNPTVLTLSRVTWGFVMGGATLLAMGGRLDWAALELSSWVILVLLAAVSTGASLTLYYRGLAHMPVHVAVALKLLSVVITVVVSWVWLKEVLNLFHLVGVAILLAGAYLLVLRTIGASPTLPQPSARGERRRLLRPLDLRARLALVAGTVIVVVVASTSYLLGSHAVSLVRNETRLAMSHVAATMLQALGAQPDASPATRERFLSSVVRSRLTGNLYSVEVVYAVLQDGRGVVLAAAHDPQALPLAPPGRRLSPAELRTALLEISAQPQRAEALDLVVVSAELAAPESPLTLTLGCARGAAGHLIRRIVARHAGVAGLIIITALLSLWFVLGQATRPLSEVVRAVGRVSEGRLHHPVLPRGDDEVGRLAGSVEAIRLALVRGRQWQDTALRLLEVAPAVPETLPGDLVYLAVPWPPAELGSSRPPREVTLDLLDFLMDREAAVEGGTGPGLLFSWGRHGPEQDDPLRAILAASDLVRAFGLSGAGAPPLLIGTDAGRLCQELERWATPPPTHPDGAEPPAILVEHTARTTEALGFLAGEGAPEAELDESGVWLALRLRDMGME